MTKRIVIAGAGGFGRGLHSWMTSSSEHKLEHATGRIVFIDDSFDRTRPSGQVINTIVDYVPRSNDAVIVAIADPVVRKRIVKELELKNCTFHRFISDQAILASNVVVGRGAVVCPGTVISSGAVVGEHAHINFNCSLGHDVQVEDYVTMSPAVNVMGEVTIGNGAFLGGSSVILPRLQIVPAAVVGAGAVVTKTLHEPGTYVGSPAKLLTQTSLNGDGI